MATSVLPSVRLVIAFIHQLEDHVLLDRDCVVSFSVELLVLRNLRRMVKNRYMIRRSSEFREIGRCFHSAIGGRGL